MAQLVALRKVKNLFDMVFEDRTSVPQALAAWPVEDGVDDKLFETARWQLIYILNDQDIIRREPEYEKQMFEMLRSIYDNLCKRIQLEDGFSERNEAKDNR